MTAIALRRLLIYPFLTLMACAVACQNKQRIDYQNPPFAEKGTRLERRSHVVDFPSPYVVESYVWVREGQPAIVQSTINAWIEEYAHRYQLERQRVEPRSIDRIATPPPILHHRLRFGESMLFAYARCLVAVDPVVIVEIDRPIESTVWHSVDARRLAQLTLDYDPYAVTPGGIYASSVLPPGRIIRWYRPRDLSTPPMTPPDDWEVLELSEDLLLVRRPDGWSEVRKRER